MAIRIMARLVIAGAILAQGVAFAGMQEMVDRFLRMGRDAMNNKDWVDCVENMSQVLELDEENLSAHLDLAYCQQEMKQWDKAAKLYRAALDLADKDQKPEILMNWGYAQASAEDLSGAEKAYVQLVEMTPEDKNAWVALGHVNKGLNKPIAAINAYQKAHELDPNDADVMETLGELCMQNGMDELAITVYERWTDAEPGNIVAKRQLAYMLAQMGACDRGKKVFDSLLAADATNPGDLLNAGTLAHKCGDLKGASSYWESYRELRPNDSAIDCRLLFLKEDTGEALAGIQLAKDALSKFPGDGCILMGYGRLLDLRGQQLQGQKKYDDAIQRYQESMAKFQQIIGHAEYGPQAQKQIQRLEQLIIRAQQMKLRDKDGFE